MKWKYFILGCLTSALLLFLGSSTSYFEPLSKSDVPAAARVMGLEFTSAEVDSMFNTLRRNRSAYESNREIPLANSVAPALMFNPLPPGFEISTDFQQAEFNIPKNVEMPEDLNELAWYSIPQLASLLRSGKITSEELTEFFIKRLQNLDDDLHFVITITEDLALAQARKADSELKAGRDRGLLHGIPYGAKDLLAKEGYKTTWGAMPYRNQVIDENATVIQRLEEAGAVLVAKLTLGALAMGDVWYGGRTRNPWNMEQGSSGSSAGSASAVASGSLPFAIGTETLGSIVSPSTRCGVTGLRPTFGRVSKSGAMALSWSMDKIGPMTRSAEDCAIVFDAIKGTDGKDLSCIEAPFNYSADINPLELKVGYLKSSFEGRYPFRSQDSTALDMIRKLGVKLVPIELPDYPDITFLLTAEAAAAFDDMTRNNRDDLLVRQRIGAWPNSLRAARFTPAVEYIQANRIRTKLIEEMQDLFEKHDLDLYINPSFASSSLRMTNMTGHPCVSVPNGFRNGTPTSITFTGKLFGEAELLAFVKMFQENTDWEDQHPNLN